MKEKRVYNAPSIERISISTVESLALLVCDGSIPTNCGTVASDAGSEPMS